MDQNNTELRLLEKRRERLIESLAAAIKARNEADGKMQSRYDTQREDAAQDVAMYEGLIAELDRLIAQISLVQTHTMAGSSTLSDTNDLTATRRVEIGKLVTIRFDCGDSEDYLLLDGQGGVELGTCQTLSTSSPVGQLILGAHIGEVRRLFLQDVKQKQQIEVEIEILEIAEL